MTLEKYLRDNKLSDAEFARIIGVSRVSVHGYRRGYRVPRPNVIQRIFKTTGGQVTAADFYSNLKPKES